MRLDRGQSLILLGTSFDSYLVVLMLWVLLARCFSNLLQLLLLSRQTDRNKDLQILLLRRQLDIARRKLHKPLRLSRAEKFLLALLTAQFKQMTRLPVNQLQYVILIFQPTSVLKWHRELVRRKWLTGSDYEEVVLKSILR